MPEHCSTMLSSNYMGRSDTIKSYSSFILLPCLLPLLTIVSACIRPCDTNNSTKSLTRIYHHSILHLKVDSVYVVQRGWTLTLAGSVLWIWLCLFFHLLAMQDLWTVSFFIFFHEVRQYKVRKWRILVFEESSDGLGGLKKSLKWCL